MKVPAEQDGWRLDKVVVALAGSRKRAREAIESGKVSVDGHVCLEPAAPVAGESRVELDWDRRGPSGQDVRARKAAERAGIGVLYIDEHVVAVDKPAGLLTDTATRAQRRDRDSLRARLEAWLDEVYIVHRIDRDTTGVVLAARSRDAEESLRTQFRERQPERVYRAIVHGQPRPAEGEWADWMHWDARARLQVPGHGKGAVLARCRYTTRAVFKCAAGPPPQPPSRGGAAEIEVQLETGRRNQVRLQAMAHGHPLVGEKQYLPVDWSGGILFERQALHALRLVVEHPGTGEPLAVEAPVPEDFQALRRRLRGGGRRRGAPTRRPR